MRQFESMLNVYHLLPRRSWQSLQSLHIECQSIGINCSMDTLRRWLKAWLAVGFVEEMTESKQYQYRQSRHQPFITHTQDALLLHWLSRYFAPLLPDDVYRLLNKQLQVLDIEATINQSVSLRQYLDVIEIDLPTLPHYYHFPLALIKKAMLQQSVIHCVFIGQSLTLLPQALVLNRQGWWLRYQIKEVALKEKEPVLSLMRLVVCLLWVDES
ncbi:hypothetical protein [Vibrio algivorus]|uniref:WYL domain-containing protein n=1 Tax=Vibrio algivorus TaxID=1667024 RepID=A0A557PFK0_9VIBR|nr:hypothetical protein [Vibrio algivorus]TVO39439.1 hypothetical protein FOF44_02305 [Vibrio algivorus]